LKTLSDYSSGGKKVRGALTNLGYRLAGGRDSKAILEASCGIELLHDFLLIHDDIVDNDITRHGRPTVHEKYSKNRGQHFGVAKAIIVGDMGAFLGYELIAQSAFPAQRKIEALTKLNDLLLKTVYGEILDIEFDFKTKVSWEDILRVRTYKTAYYTFVMPLTVGAVLGKAGKKTLEIIEKYGVPVGLAFQLADDILGVFGNPSKTGKSNESDIREGKKTLLFAKSLELSGETGKRFLFFR
jgi:geranylgeranyl diphosphate synthase type I